MNACQVHRGPDDAGVFLDGPVGLAHRRLSIIDPEAGQQPLFNEEETVAVVFNGEIYNHESLRADLEAEGHHFTTAADTEVIVHGYEKWGEEVVSKLEGIFAFSLWDADAEHLLLARDRMGIKPLFLARDGDRTAFASELNALLESGFDLGGLNRTAVQQYLVYGFVPDTLTAFQNVSRLRPGERVIITAEGVRRERYYTPTVTSRDPSLDTAATDLRGLVRASIDRRLMSDVPLGAFLSGGIDSSIVVGTMADLSPEPVNTFTVGFEESVFDERWAAREVADYHDTNHHEYTVTPADVRDVVPDVLDRLGEPFADPSLLPTYVVARETSQDVTVALSGDGADELFAGYEKYRGEYLSRYYRTLPRSLQTRIVEPAVHALPVHRDSRSGEFARKAEKFLRAGEPDPLTRHLDWLRHPDGDALAVVGDDSIQIARARLEEAHDEVAKWYDADDFQRMLAVDTTFTLPNQMLRKVDRAGMYNSLEVRVPFLDTDVVEYALSLPRSYKISARERKRVLRRAFDDVLPPKIKKRGKQGFDIPVGEWLRGPMAAEFRDTVRSDPTALLDGDDVLSVFEQHRDGHRDHTNFLWNVYVYALWAKRMNDRGIAL